MIHMHDSNVPWKSLPKVISEVKILLLFQMVLMLIWEIPYFVVKHKQDSSVEKNPVKIRK